MEIENIKKMSEELKEGATLSFYSSKKWYSKIIPFFSREAKGENPPVHVGNCWEIKREGNFCEFYLSEQGFSGGSYQKVKIANHNNYYFFKSFSNEQYEISHRLNDYVKINVLNLKKPLSQEQIRKGIEDAKSQVGKKYNYLQFFLAAEFFEKILPKFILKKLGKSNLNICSMHIVKNYYKIGVIKAKPIGIVSPNELIKFDIFE
jgi:hypothetical protein